MGAHACLSSPGLLDKLEALIAKRAESKTLDKLKMISLVVWNEDVENDAFPQCIALLAHFKKIEYLEICAGGPESPFYGASNRSRESWDGYMSDVRAFKHLKSLSITSSASLDAQVDKEVGEGPFAGSHNMVKFCVRYLFPCILESQGNDVKLEHVHLNFFYCHPEDMMSSKRFIEACSADLVSMRIPFAIHACLSKTGYQYPKLHYFRLLPDITSIDGTPPEIAWQDIDMFSALHTFWCAGKFVGSRKSRATGFLSVFMPRDENDQLRPVLPMKKLCVVILAIEVPPERKQLKLLRTMRIGGGGQPQQGQSILTYLPDFGPQYAPALRELYSFQNISLQAIKQPAGAGNAGGAAAAAAAAAPAPQPNFYMVDNTTDDTLYPHLQILIDASIGVQADLQVPTLPLNQIVPKATHVQLHLVGLGNRVGMKMTKERQRETIRCIDNLALPADCVLYCTTSIATALTGRNGLYDPDEHNGVLVEERFAVGVWVDRLNREIVERGFSLVSPCGTCTLPRKGMFDISTPRVAQSAQNHAAAHDNDMEHGEERKEDDDDDGSGEHANASSKRARRVSPPQPMDTE